MTKQIELTRGQVALVDDDVYEWLMHYKWQAMWQPHAKHYVAGRKVSGKTVYMHRVIMMAPDGIEVDHWNHDGLDCRRSNLRLCTTSENRRNSLKHKARSSRYKGVRRYKDTWIAVIGRMNLGRFSIEEAAARAYDAVARQEYGEFARTNFAEGDGDNDYLRYKLPPCKHMGSTRLPKSDYRGVIYYCKTGRWLARCGNHYCGYHDTPEEAARAYDAKARETFGQQARLNFPDPHP